MAFHTHPGLNQYQALKKLPDEQPFDQLVQLRFRAEAVYPDGERRPVAESYSAYGRAVYRVLHRVGAQSIWRGRPLLTLIGPELDQWDSSYILRYPTVAAYHSVLGDAEYTDACRHWNACVEDCRVHCLAVVPGAGF